ncbi:MAG: hypothetical protein GYB19_10225 [Rhodospirillales bacterium]|nr:hypothetical protein [Rhodospirillales bacterium]
MIDMIEDVFRCFGKTGQRIVLACGVVICCGLAVLVFLSALAQPEQNPGFIFSFGFAGVGFILAQALIHHLLYGWV